MRLVPCGKIAVEILRYSLRHEFENGLVQFLLFQWCVSKVFAILFFGILQYLQVLIFMFFQI